MTGPPPLSTPPLSTARSLLALLRLYVSTGETPEHLTPALMRQCATTFTGKAYVPNRNGSRTAARDLAAWISAKEKEAAQ